MLQINEMNMFLFSFVISATCFILLFYSDKEFIVNVEKNQLTIVITTPNHGGWRKVEKKKGTKG